MTNAKTFVTEPFNTQKRTAFQSQRIWDTSEARVFRIIRATFLGVGCSVCEKLAFKNDAKLQDNT